MWAQGGWEGLAGVVPPGPRITGNLVHSRTSAAMQDDVTPPSSQGPQEGLRPPGCLALPPPPGPGPSGCCLDPLL